MNKLSMRLIQILIMALHGQSLFAQDSNYLLFHNGFGEKMEFWLYAREPQGWRTPVVCIDVEETRNVTFESESPCYVVLVDSKFNKDRLGWFDFHSLATKDPGTKVELRALYRHSLFLEGHHAYLMTGQYPYITDSQPPTPELPTGTQLAYAPVVPGKIYLKTPQLQVVSEDGGRSALAKLDLEDIPELPGAKLDELPTAAVPPPGPRLGISFHICPSGVHILSVTDNSPATRCRDASSRKVELQVGDHIVEINGRQPRTDSEAQQLIARSEKRLVLTLLDLKTGERVELSTELE